MNNERRIARLTREALGEQDKRKTYTQLDDCILRAVGIVVLIVTVIVFASWPRGVESERRPSKAGDAGSMATSIARYAPGDRIG